MLGYELVSTTTFNGIFVQHQYYPLFHMPDNSIDTMHDVPMPTEFFQLYDGTLKITGVKKLLWKKQPINEKDIQVLSAAQRRFPFIPPDIEREMANADALFLDAQKDSANRGAVARHFVELVQRWSVHCSYPNEDIRRFAGYALSLGRGDAAVAAALLAFYEQTADVHFKANSPQHAIQWLKQALYLPSVQENLVHKAHVMTRVGEAYLRQHRYDKAEFWLQMSMALEGHDKTTLKTLAKLYTKLGHTDAQRRIVDELRALNTD
ncbi:hypothetical protein AaE_006254 [Aphanomyces astaci]|uniref:Uncharacterized protein n=1 Tax=Aphanomyces astaci TaxID=112090 RepID=A0A6A5ADT7_APHAT|nr:hypothetical protein AaE_006254 [Aphanomyces astaci]